MTNEMMPKSHLLDLRHPRFLVKINNCLVFNFTVYEIETNEEPEHQIEFTIWKWENEAERYLDDRVHKNP